MARTAEGAALTQQHRSDQLAVRAAMLLDIRALWAVVDPLDLSSTIERFATAAAVAVGARHEQSGRLGRRYFGEFRIVEGIGAASQVPDIVDSPPVRVAAGVLRGAGLKGIIDARRGGFSPGAAAQQGLVRASGSATSLTLNGGRNTVRAGINADEEARGWIRITSGRPCAFCAMIASRAETNLFSTAKTADFQAHDHCVCTIEPIYPDSEIPELNQRFREQWDRAQREVEVSGTQNPRLTRFRRLIEGRE